MFGSNFPVQKLWTKYSDLVAAYRNALAPLGKATSRTVLHDTAARVYRL
jgi:predicted TIM-barrel fold metal-dependent hydrolase